MILEGKGLVVRYPGSDRPALDGVDATLRSGELVAVLGPNGGGKTTLLRGLLGAVPLDGGTATVEGVAVDALPRAALARVAAALPQREEPTFALSVEEFVFLGRYPHLGPFAPPAKEDRLRVAEALERCDVQQLRGRTIDTLSGGEWQRVRVARALAQTPRNVGVSMPVKGPPSREPLLAFRVPMSCKTLLSLSEKSVPPWHPAQFCCWNTVRPAAPAAVRVPSALRCGLAAVPSSDAT